MMLSMLFLRWIVITLCSFEVISSKRTSLWQCGFEENEDGCNATSLQDDTFTWSIGDIPYDGVMRATAFRGTQCLNVDGWRLKKEGAKKASMVSPSLGHTGRICIQFFYNASGGQKSTLSLVLLSNPADPIWSEQMNTDTWSAWNRIVVQHYLTNESDAVALVVQVEGWTSSGELLVDEFKITKGCCLPEDCKADWTSWLTWEDCDSGCGVRKQKRRRHCLSSHDDKRCEGDDTEIRTCPQLEPCQVTEDHSANPDDNSTAHGENSTVIGDHSTVAGEHSAVDGDHSTVAGEHSTVDGDHSTMDGDHSAADGDQSTVDGDHSVIADDHPSVVGWLPWSEWSACAVTCGQGERHRDRKCSNESCDGNTTESDICQLAESCEDRTPRWQSWSTWTVCAVSCGPGNRTRTRLCVNSDIETPCLQMEIENCSLVLSCSDERNQDSEPTWQSWTSWGACSLSCGEGSKIRTRTCGHMGSDVSCVGDNVVTKECSATDCPVRWGAWGDWSKCDGGCGVGKKNRARTCQSNDTTLRCEGKGWMEKPCTKDADCIATWESWQKWSVCSSGCGKGFKQRIRVCESPDSEITCPGNEMAEARCSMHVDCPAQWSSWGSWGECDSGCGIGFKHRQRFCQTTNLVSHCIGGALQPKMCHVSEDCKKCPANCYKCDKQADRCDHDYCMKGFYIDNSTGICHGVLRGSAVRTVVGAFTYLVPAILVPIAIIVVSVTAACLLMKKKRNTPDDVQSPTTNFSHNDVSYDVLKQSVHKLSYMHIHMDHGLPGETPSHGGSLVLGDSLIPLATRSTGIVESRVSLGAETVATEDGRTMPVDEASSQEESS